MLVLAALLAASTPAFDVIQEASHALRQGRPVQAREMVRAAVGAGASGAAVDRLLADLAFAEGRWAEATIRYEALIAVGERSSPVLEQAAIAALKQGDDRKAMSLLAQAEMVQGAGWRMYNVQGVLADRAQDWAAADAAYRRGLKLEPSSPELLNNYGWSLLLRGQWSDAHRQISKAAALAPGDRKIAANLDLAASALAADLPGRRQGESSFSYAARLNDTGMLALRAGQKDKAQAAFARALELSEHWFTRAANNLALSALAAPLAER
jgi:Flp pilus assembly protein TadD